MSWPCWRRSAVRRRPSHMSRPGWRAARAGRGARAGMSQADRADPRNRIPGWGHRVYKVDDPRAARLRAIGRRLAERAGVLPLFETAETVYRVMKAETDLPGNVDFSSRVLYRRRGVPLR